MATLTGQPIDQSYSGLLKTEDNGVIGGVAKGITDGVGGVTNMTIATTATNFVSGTVDFTGSTVSGLPVDPNTTYDLTATQATNDIDIDLVGSDATTDKIKVEAGTNITLTKNADGFKIDAASGGAAGLESGTGTDSMESSAALTTTAADASGAKTVALGDGAIASSEHNIAIGTSASASGDAAFARTNIAIGFGTVASNEKDLAVGSSASATGARTTAIGANSTASGGRAIAIGASSQATAFSSACFGAFSAATGEGSVVLGGYDSSATAIHAIAIGKEADSFNDSAMAIGRLAQATADGAVALGANVTGNVANTVSVKALETQTDGGVQIKGDGTNAGKLKLFCEDATGAHNVTLEGPAHAGGATYALKFPNVQSAGTQILEADASGNLAWINTPSGGGGGGTEYTEGQAITPAISVSNYSIPWILSGYGQTAGKAFQLANNIQFIPFYAKAGEAISDFYFRVQNAQAGATMDVGLYKAYTSTVNGFKQTMPEYVADIATGVDVSTTGKKSFTSLNVSLPADAVGGCYWLAFQSDTLGVALTKWSNWVAAERQIYSDIYRGTGVEKTSATFGLPTGQVSLTGSGLSASTDLPIDFAWRYKS
tara:strand:- start:2491 stop:4299 length:1809 start_codon:yes stop_codon:yes gene_type:complete